MKSKSEIIKSNVFSYMYDKDLMGVINCKEGGYLGSNFVNIYYKDVLITAIILKDNVYIESAGNILRNTNFSKCVSYDKSVEFREVLSDIRTSMEYIRLSESIIRQFMEQASDFLTKRSEDKANYYFRIKDECDCYLTLTPKGYKFEVVAQTLSMDEISQQCLEKLSSLLDLDIILRVSKESKYLATSKVFA